MPSSTLSASELRAAFRSPESVSERPFQVISSLASLASQRAFDEEVQDLILRALEHRDRLGSSSCILDGLVREVGLFPFLDAEQLSLADRIAFEFHRPRDMQARDIVFHRPQARVYRQLLNRKSVILSAPTSFGKSVVIDAVVAAGVYSNLLVVVPTLALVDETRRRLAQYADSYRVITHPSQSRGSRNVFVLTQERALQLADIDKVDFLAIDEFYKLSMEREEAGGRAALLNQLFYSVVRRGTPFYLLGPSVTGLAEGVAPRLEAQFIVEPYHTVASELHRVQWSGDQLAALSDLCSTLDGPTIVFCKSPLRASKIARYLVANGVGAERPQLAAALSWLADNYHPDWHFSEALASGIGVHHGRIPRALAQYVVRLFDDGVLPLLICTSTLIEGVNTKAKNIIIFDNTINKQEYDYFTFNNIRGRSGRMFQHYVGHVYLFHEPPPASLPFVDIPSISQSQSAPQSLLVQLNENELTPESRERLRGLRDQQALSLSTIRENVGVDPEVQVALARAISEDLRRFHAALYWTSFPTKDQLRFICEVIWKYFGGSKLGSGSAKSAKQLAFLVGRLRSAPSTTELIVSQMAFGNDPDAAVQGILDFQRLWATFHFPQLLRTIERIQREVFRRARLPVGTYEAFASRVESLFLDPSTVALDEYGVPLEIARKLEPILDARGDLDIALARLAELDLASLDLAPFEKEMVVHAIEGLAPSDRASRNA